MDMGYGHQRAAYPLRHFSPTGKVLIANNYQGIPKKDSNLWNSTRYLYEIVSRLKNVPLIGDFIFGIMDSMQAIPDFYPKRDLSGSIMQLRVIYNYIKSGWGKDLVNYLNSEDIPLITTFFTVAFFAEEHGFKNDIYCVLCDTDISRAWVALNPKKSRIKYLAPCRRVVDRLKLYGVKEENIFLTGFPLPEENLGGNQLKTLKADLSERVINLDPEKRYRQKYSATIKQFLQDIKIEERHHHPLTLTFAVGGAGAQKLMANDILASLKKKILHEEIKINMVAGSRNDVYSYFRDVIKKLGLNKKLDENVKIIFSVEKEDYFRNLNHALRTTDVFWTKPSELTFYTALGLPIVMAPSLGSQEVYNRQWLKTIGGGITQNNPKYTSEWLFDWVNSGWLAEAAMAGFLDGRQFGVYNIGDVVFNGVKEPTKNYQLL